MFFFFPTPTNIKCLSALKLKNVSGKIFNVWRNGVLKMKIEGKNIFIGGGGCGSFVDALVVTLFFIYFIAWDDKPGPMTAGTRRECLVVWSVSCSAYCNILLYYDSFNVCNKPKNGM